METPLLWVVVAVQAGVPVLAEVYRKADVARKRERTLLKQFDPNDDVVAVFEVEVDVPSPNSE